MTVVGSEEICNKINRQTPTYGTAWSARAQALPNGHRLLLRVSVSGGFTTEGAEHMADGGQWRMLMGIITIIYDRKAVYRPMFLCKPGSKGVDLIRQMQLPETPPFCA